MNTGKILSATAKLTDTSNDVLSLEKIVQGKKVELFLIERHRPFSPIDDNYITHLSNETILFVDI